MDVPGVPPLTFFDGFSESAALPSTEWVPGFPPFTFYDGFSESGAPGGGERRIWIGSYGSFFSNSSE